MILNSEDFGGGGEKKEDVSDKVVRRKRRSESKRTRSSRRNVQGWAAVPAARDEPGARPGETKVPEGGGQIVDKGTQPFYFT